MRKILITLILSSIITSNLFACLCTADIESGFSSATNRIKKVLTNATNEITNNVNPNIKKNIDNITKQNKILTKIIIEFKKRDEQKKELIFLLNKLKEMQD